MTIMANADQVAEAGLDILATVGAYLNDPASLADAVLPDLPVEAVYLGAAAALAAFVKYTGITADDLIEVGGFFAVTGAVDNNMEESNEQGN